MSAGKGWWRRGSAAWLCGAMMAPAAHGAPAPEMVPRDVVDARAALARAPSATIARDGLVVSVVLPDAVSGFYRGTRFDWSGIIGAVRYQGHSFYGPWFDGIAANIRDFTDDGHAIVAGPQTAAMGPAEEFVEPMPDPTPGFADAPVGGTFLKIGVGRLRKPDDKPYSRFRAYDIVDGGHWTVRRTKHRIVFRQIIAPDAAGYGYIYTKTLVADPGGGLTISHALRNIGSRPIASQVYNHNFTRFDDRDLEPGLTVQAPYPLVNPVSAPDLAVVEGDRLTYRRSLRAGDHVTLALTGASADPSSSGFEITAPSGARIAAMSDSPILRAALWSVRSVVAVEPFIAIDCKPHAEQRWRWRYTFTTGAR